ncbi:hypothetical protein Tco_1485368 [Tanacetum coccineum]
MTNRRTNQGWKAFASNQGAKTRQRKGPDENNKEGEASGKDKAMAILMVQPWKRVARKRVTQSFSPNLKISFPPLGDEDGTEGPMIIEAEIGGHFIHRIENRGCETFDFYMDELCCGKITISIQWDHKEAMSLENSGSPINRSRNVKIPSSRRNTHTVKQQVYPTRMHDGLKTISSTLTEEGRKTLCGLLRRNLDIFAWKPEDMTGVPRHIAEHRLNVREGCPPVRQKKRSQAPERNKAIQDEV